MAILVTGGAGFIGSNIVDRLIELDFNVVVVDNLSTGNLENINRKAKFYKVSILDDQLASIFVKENITYVIHHAAQTDMSISLEDPIYDLKSNVIGTVKLLEECVKNDIKKIIYASSAAVYGEPNYLPIDENHPVQAVSAYGISKYASELYIKMYKKLYDLNYSILRYANVYGPRQANIGEGGVIAKFINQILAGMNPTIFGDGKQTRDFIFVKDIIEANIQSLKISGSQLCNISSKEQHTINNIYNTIKTILSTDIEVKYRQCRNGDIKNSCLDNSKAKKILRWTPKYNLQDGLFDTVSYYKTL